MKTKKTKSAAEPKNVDCECGQWSGERCQWSGPRSKTVEVEFMPEHLKSSHEAAGNLGSYPHNGAERIRVEKSCAKGMRNADDWVHIVKAKRKPKAKRAPRLGAIGGWHTNGKWTEPKSPIPNSRLWKMDRGDASFLIFGPPVDPMTGRVRKSSTYSAVVSGNGGLKPVALGDAKTLNLAKALINKWIKRAMAS